MLRLDGVTLTVGPKELLADADLHVRPGDRVGLVGRNGTGKTSLLRLLVGELDADRGQVHRRGGARLGYLPQHAVSGSTESLWKEAESGMTRIVALRDRLRRAEEAMARQEGGSLEAWEKASEAFRLGGGYEADETIGEVLHGLGFRREDWEKSCDTFSGGWQMRIALARVLLSEPDVLLLDEPTNHLDVVARTWLVRFLEKQRRTMVVVSHDRYLLDRLTNRTAEVRHKNLTVYTGNVTAWLAERAQREAALDAAREAQGKEIAKLERFVERFGAKATKAAQANARKKQLDKIDRIDAPLKDAQPVFRLPEPPDCSPEAVVLSGVSVGWEPGVPVVSEVDLVIHRGMRLAILGRNGDGKSTLLAAIEGRLPLLGGRRRLGVGVRMGAYAQDLASALPLDATGLDLVAGAGLAVAPQRARSALGALGLSGDRALQPIGQLSGGERARVVLARLAVSPCNVLLLDEPTNHLDTDTVEALVDELSRFEGAVVFVTHDRYVVERVATHVARIEGGKLEMHPGVRPTDFEWTTARAPAADKGDEPSEDVSHYEARKEKRRERAKAQRRIEKITAEVDQIEARMSEIDEQMFELAHDYAKANALEGERKDLAARLDALYEAWESLEASIAD